MKSKFLLLFCSLFIGQLAFSQVSRSERKRYIKKYEQFFEKDTKLMYIDYYQTTEKVGKYYVHKIYNPDKVMLTHNKRSTDKAGKNLNGNYEEWYDNGNKWLEGTYADNKKVGVWKNYNYSNSKIESGSYLNEKKEGEWIAKNASEQIIFKKNYKDGALNGFSTYYDTTGQVKFIITYLSDSIINEEILDTLFYNEKSDILKNPPVLKTCNNLEGEDRKKCSDITYLKFIYSDIKYPILARQEGIEGMAMISFVIEKDGSLSEFTTYRGICKEIEKECIRVLKKSPQWSPGTKNGEAVRVMFNMPVRFRLE